MGLGAQDFLGAITLPAHVLRCRLVLLADWLEMGLARQESLQCCCRVGEGLHLVISLFSRKMLRICEVLTDHGSLSPTARPPCLGQARCVVRRVAATLVASTALRTKDSTDALHNCGVTCTACIE